MSTRNFEEYRAEVLEQLGATAEDLRNEPSWRAKVLESLGAEYTDEDTRNFERYRLKVLENLSGGGSGGGGSSDFSTAEVTIQITTENPDVYVAIPAIVTTPMDMILNQQYNTLNSSTAQMLTVPLYKGTLAVTGNSVGEISVNVNGSVQQVGALDFIITGDCTITIS